MCKSVVDKSIDSFIADMGDSLSYWTSYLTSVKRGHVLQESAIRYAISEFLEVNKHNECGSPIIKEYCFEKDHPYYRGKSSDLYYKVAFLNRDPASLFIPSTDNGSDTEEKEFTIEFKYVRNEARDTNGNEFQRYVKDLCRLHCVYKNEERTVCLGGFGFITQALKEATDMCISHPDTSFLRLTISEINELRGDADKDDVETVLLIEPDEKFNVKLVYSNRYPVIQNKLHPDTLVCIWEVS